MTLTEEAFVSWKGAIKIEAAEIWYCVHIKDYNAHLLSVEGREESECIPVWSEEGTPMPPAIWFI